MDMFRAKCRNAALPAMYIAPIRWDASHSQIRIEILASKILGRTRQANSIVRALSSGERTEGNKRRGQIVQLDEYATNRRQLLPARL